MIKQFYTLAIVLMASALSAQDSSWFYATMPADDAQILQNQWSDEIQILKTANLQSAVYMSPKAAEQLKNNNQLHGPGYIFRAGSQQALSRIENGPQINARVLDFTIDQDDFVNLCLGMVNEANLENTILELEAYGTRFHNQTPGIQFSYDLKDKWQDMVDAANRSDITVTHYEHGFTEQRSVILNIPGSLHPDELVVIGGHLDSGDSWSPVNAPGADDNASGIATLTEVLQVLLDADFHPARTVQIMAYAAEEIGLYGSADIAYDYYLDGKDVLGVMQLDMTNYKGSVNDIYLVNDSQYVSSDLNLFLIDLMEHYNASGTHEMSYGTTACGYACSDHVSWTENGFLASFPTESKISESNPFIHTPNDTYANMDNSSEHSVKFVKLGLEFVIELAKIEQAGTQELKDDSVLIAVQNRELVYQFKSNQALKSIEILDTAARKLVSRTQVQSNGNLSLNGLKSGVYIAIFKTVDGKTYTKKFLLK